MKKYTEILSIANSNNGLITTNMIVDAGYLRSNINYLLKLGSLIRVSRGVYKVPNGVEDDFLNLQTKYKKGIYCLETALYLHKLIDIKPNNIQMTFPKTYNYSNPKNDGILCNNSVEPYYSLGIESIISPQGNILRAYNLERTLCDILKPVKNRGLKFIREILQKYMLKENKNISFLSECSRALKVEKELKLHLELLTL